jgi:hypothetical protein
MRDCCIWRSFERCPSPRLPPSTSSTSLHPHPSLLATDSSSDTLLFQVLNLPSWLVTGRLLALGARTLAWLRTGAWRGQWLLDAVEFVGPSAGFFLLHLLEVKELGVEVVVQAADAAMAAALGPLLWVTVSTGAAFLVSSILVRHPIMQR